MWKSIVLSSSLFSIITSLVVCTSYGVVAVHQYAVSWVDAEWRGAVEVVAKRYGYQVQVVRGRELSRDELVTRAAMRKGINPTLLRAKVRVESGGKQYAMSRVGALGLLQIMPENAKRCGLQVAELLEEEKNIECGAKLFREDLDATQWRVVEALERYNGGPKCVGGKCAESIKHARLVLAEMAKDIRPS